ncbi:amidoligase [Clostridiaceae bacterium AF42-6]|nr:amidoligase [Clostridiaceae bacterium AF42-6]
MQSNACKRFIKFIIGGTKMASKNERAEMKTMIHQMTYGVEVEMTAITRESAAHVTASVLGAGSSVHYLGGAYHKYQVIDPQGREWLFVSDCSINAIDSNGRQADSRGAYSCELNTPPLYLADMDTLQNVIRALRNAGAKTGARYGCGIHVHVGSKEHTARSLKNFINLVFSQEEMLYKALGVDESRIRNWCVPMNNRRGGYSEHGTPTNFMNDLKGCKTIEQIETAWYKNFSGSAPEYCRTSHYDESRYHLLNLHRYFSTRGKDCNTIEIRAFNATLHAGVIRSFVLLVLSMNAKALTSTRIKAEKNPIMTAGNEKFAMRTWLVSMGWTGDMFKNPRQHLLKNLAGNSAWRFGKSGDLYR